MLFDGYCVCVYVVFEVGWLFDCVVGVVFGWMFWYGLVNVDCDVWVYGWCVVGVVCVRCCDWWNICVCEFWCDCLLLCDGLVGYVDLGVWWCELLWFGGYCVGCVGCLVGVCWYEWCGWCVVLGCCWKVIVL